MKSGERPSDPSVTPGESEDALTVAMRRAGASTAFFLTVPGPKMIWQFGEIGYDYSIDYNDRTGEKPAVTDKYMAEPAGTWTDYINGGTVSGSITLKEGEFRLLTK